MSFLIKIHYTLLLLLFFTEISVGQVIIDSCFMSAASGTSFASSSNLAGQDGDLLSWTGSAWTGGWPGANLTIPPPNNGVGCRAIFIGSASSWTTGGEGFGLRFTPALVTGQTYTFNITYVSHGTGSDGNFAPRFFTNSTGSMTGAYLVGNLAPAGYAWTTNPVTFTATAAQSGHTWIYMHSGPSGSSGMVNNFCPSCNISCNPTFNPVGPYCSGASIPALPATSLNGVPGTWSPAINNTATTTYTFTPSNGCATTTTLTITINPNVTPAFNSLGPYCVGATPGTLPTTSTNGISGTWSPATINTATPGTSTYTFTPAAGQCATTKTMSVTVNPNITPAFTAFGPYCVGATPGALPTTSTNGITGTWNPATINTATAGTSTYTFTPTAGQCATTTTMSVTVSSSITPTFTALGPYCVGATPGALPTTSTNSITGTWNPATISTATTGTITYTFTPTSGQCAAATTMSVTVSSNITPTFTVLGPYCTGATPATLPLTSTNGINGTWSPTTISTATAGTSTYTFTPSAGQCATTTTMSVTVNPNITPLFTALGPYCTGATPGTLPLTSTNSIAGIWNPSTISTATSGTTTYTFTPTAGQCAISISIDIVVNAIPDIYASASPTNICFGQSSEIYASGAANYVWQPGNMSGNFITVLPNTSTNYTVTGDVNGCTASGSVTVNVYPYPVISFSADNMEGCEDLLVQFTDMSNFNDATWYWEFSDNTFSYQQNPLHYFNDQGTYDVTLTMTTIYGCTSSFTWQDMITVYKTPDAEFVNVPESPSELEPTVWFFDRSAGASAWEWNFGDYLSLTNNSNEQNATHMYSDTGVFTVMLVVYTDYGCRDTAWHTVYIEPDVSIYVPNAFTPNDDPQNPNFICKGEGIDWSTFEMLIYDRWGKQLFYTNDHETGWNGEYKGVVMPQDVYTWLISFTDIRLKKHNLKGIVTLIK